jgi:glutamate/tyrosine decarboxylase-like PLP-dependent enzyme
MNNNRRDDSTDNLDPHDWDAFGSLAHQMLDDMLNHGRTLPERPVWQPAPETVRNHFHQPLPQTPSSLDEVHADFMANILPYAVGNGHPRFMGWVHGGGTPVGMLAEMLAAGLNANVGGRNQIPVEVEWQVVAWMRELFGFPATASGLFVTGTSSANHQALLVARTALLGAGVRASGIQASGLRLTAYASVESHVSVVAALDYAGIGTDALRMIPVNDRYEVDVSALADCLARDRAAGFTPLWIVGTAGSVNVGAIDDLNALADLAAQEQVWFHVDGAYGALALMAPDLAPRLKGIERADSIACDFHKWGQVPYDAGFLMIRDGSLHLATFASRVAYLNRQARGLASGGVWPCDLGIDLSRGFRALKAWFTLKVYGSDRLGRVMSTTCRLAAYLGQRIEAEPRLELLAPVMLNIVCFAYRAEESDRVNAAIVIDLQESGIAAPSTTVLKGRLAIRAALVNHRTRFSDMDILIEATLAAGERHAC